MSETKAIISAQNLAIGYVKKPSDFVVAKNVDFNINQGDFIAVLGQNGIGKSTLLKTLIGEIPHLNGTIDICTKPLQDYTVKELSSFISVVLTEPIPLNQLTVYELVALGRQPYTNWIDSLTTEDKQIIVKVLEQTESIDLRDKKIYELSDGMKQRVLIARALAQDTPIMVLDEPTVHLDLYHTVKIFKLLQELVTKFNKTIIISSHQLNLALQFSNKFLVMNENSVFFGTKDYLINAKAFDTLFPSESVRFNPKTHQFIVS